MHLSDAIGLCEKGQMVTCDLLPEGAVVCCDEAGTLRVKFLATGDGYNFSIHNEHHLADWREYKQGWTSYG